MAYLLEISKDAQDAFHKLSKKDKQLIGRAEKEIDKILKHPEAGKPLRHDLKNYRRIRVGSFVLVYEILGDTIRIDDFDHHDKIYKRG